MRRFLIQAALVVMMASPAVARADSFTLTWISNSSPQSSEILTFYLPPDPIPPSEYGQGISAEATANLNGGEFAAKIGFSSPSLEPTGFLHIEGGPFSTLGQCCPAVFESNTLINDSSPGDPFIAGTHPGFFQGSDRATLVITPDASTVPEPSSLLLLATGVLGLGVAAYRKSRSLLNRRSV